jgi:hypothetical protein
MNVEYELDIILLIRYSPGLWRRDSGCPEPPATDPDVQFSRIRFLGRTTIAS